MPAQCRHELAGRKRCQLKKITRMLARTTRLRVGPRRLKNKSAPTTSLATGSKVPIKYILQLAQGSVVELDALAGEPMDVLVNGYLIAQGEVVVVNDKFGIRLTDVVTPSERLRRVSRG